MAAAGVKAMSSANKAATAARKRLIEAHREEYDGYVREERTRLGLPANPEEAKLQARREKLRQQILEIDEKLNN